MPGIKYYYYKYFNACKVIQKCELEAHLCFDVVLSPSKIHYVSQASFVVITFKIESVKLKSQSLYIVFSLIYLNDVFSLIV